MKKRGELSRDIGRQVREARKAAGMTQEEVALKLGVKKNTVCRWENARRGLTVDQLVKVARAIGVRVHISWGNEKIIL